MESLQIRTGQISLRILDDAGEERGIFKFNPTDIEGAKRLMDFRDAIQESEKEYFSREENCKTAEERVALLTDTVNFHKKLIDNCFGEGTSQLLFGNACTLSMFNDFLDGITPYYEKASKARMSKYSKKKPVKGE